MKDSTLKQNMDKAGEVRREWLSTSEYVYQMPVGLLPGKTI